MSNKYLRGLIYKNEFFRPFATEAPTFSHLHESGRILSASLLLLKKLYLTNDYCAFI